MISIVSGRFRGRHLKVPKKGTVRPTANRVREALFNILEHRIIFEEYSVFDLFAGTGALGLEALSRGAKTAYFIECSRSTLSVLKENINCCIGNLKPSEPEEQHLQIQIIHDRSEHWLTHCSEPQSPFLIFLDPPYLGGEYETILSLLAQQTHIPSGTWVAVESSAQNPLSFPSEFECVQQKGYGTVRLDLLQKRGAF